MVKYPYGNIDFHSHFLFQKTNFFPKLFFIRVTNFFSQIFCPINKKNFFRQKKLFVQRLKIDENVFHNFKNIIVQHNFLEIKKF